MIDDAVRELLRRAADAAGEDFHPPSPAAFRARRDKRRHTSLAVGASIAVVAAAIGLVVGLTGSRSTPRPSPAVTNAPVIHGGPITAGQVTAHDLSAYRWATLPPAPIATRSRSAAVWTGSQMIVWGGRTRARAYADGAVYTPSTRTWQTLPASPLTPRSNPYALWTGTRLIIWGGVGPAGTAGTGAVYDPSTGRWTSMPAAPAAHGEIEDFVWTGTEALRLSINTPFAATAVTVTAYNPDTNSWHVMPNLRFGSTGNYTSVTGATVQGQFVVWVSSAGSYTYQPDTYAWQSAPYAPGGAGCIYEAIPTPTSIIYPANFLSVSCGGDLAYHLGTRGTQLDLANQQSRTIAYTPTSDGDAAVTWTGRALLNADANTVDGRIEPGGTDIHTPEGTSAAWNPTTNTWTRVARAPAHDPNATWIWTGTQLIGWGNFQPTHPGGDHTATLTLTAG